MEILTVGDKVHAGLLAQYDGQVRRAFIGVVEAYEAGLARIRGRSWFFDPMQGIYAPKEDERSRIISLSSGRYVVNILPPATKMDKLRYHLRPDGALVLTDGGALLMDVSEGDVRRGAARPQRPGGFRGRGQDRS